MKIFPRQISIESGKDEYELNIRNSAVDDRVLLFKIRRSEHKIVEFSPKAGYVIAGQTLKISLKQVSHSMDKSRLLVKLVVLKRSLLEEDFEQSWTIASKRNGEVKKVIDIVDYTMASPAGHGKRNSSSHKQQQRSDQDHQLKRVYSDDSDGVSEISMQQSAFSSAFYPPTPSVCSPDQVQSHKTKKLNLASIDRAHLEERNAEEESLADAVAGSVIEFDQYSFAHNNTAAQLEDSVELQSVSQSMAESQQMQQSQLATEIELQNGNRSRQIKSNTMGSADTSANDAVLSSDQQAMMAILVKLAQSPATSTLLSQLLLAQQLQSTALSNPAFQAVPVPVMPTNLGRAPAPHVNPAAAPNQQTMSDVSYYDTHPVSHAELTRRYLYAENEAFPSIRQPQFDHSEGYYEGKNDHAPPALNPDHCSRLTVIPSSAVNRQLRDEFSDTASINDSLTGAISSNNLSGGRENCLLELSGPHIDNHALMQIAELRLEEATQEKRKVIAIEVAEASITSLQASIGQVFAPSDENTNDATAGQSALQAQLNALRATVLEDNLKHLTVNGCMQLSHLDPSVNRFRSLTTLNLSGNRLRSLSGPLDLPALRSIDLSHNLLASLDFLQLLTNLSSLNASNNRIVSLGLSINMLVAHSKCLVALDLSANPVCDDRHYAQEVIHVLPRLRYFDSVDLESASQAYSHSHSHRAASAGRGASATSTPQRRGLKADRRLPDLPDEVRSIRSGNSVSSTGTKLSYAERRQDFERRVQLALAQRRKIAALSPNSRSERSPPPGQANHVKRSDSRPRAGVPATKQVRGPAAGKSREHDRYAAFSDDNDNTEDDQDAEMRSVQDSIQQLDSSMRRNRGGGGAAPHPSHNQSGFVPTSMTQANQLASHSVDSSHHRGPSGNAHREDGELHQGELSRAHEEASENVAGRSSAEGEAGYFAHTASYHSKRRVSAPSLIEHWAGHQTTTATTGLGPQSLVDVPILDANSTLLDPTESIRNRATFYGTISRSQRFPNHPVNASRSRLYSSFSLGESYRGASAGRHSPRHRQADKESGNDESRGYFSEGELSMTRRSSVRRAATVVPHTEQDFMEMQESERYGAWHPRYRVPKPIYGFSKPFAHRHAPSLKDHAPLFDTTVQRMRDSFRRDPGRGTFSRAGKGLPGEWYPMDYSDVEAIRRQGYFHETIGEVAKDSYRDTVSAQQAQLKATHTSVTHTNRSAGGGEHGSTALELSLDPLNLTQNTSNTHGTQASKGKFLQEALVSPKGSVSLSPQKAGRRQSWGPHMSRYDRATSVVHAYDDFSGFRKWHQGLFDENKDGAARVGGGGEGRQSLQRSGSEAGGGNDRGLQSFSMDGMDRSAFSVDAHQPRQQQLPQYPGEDNQDRNRASPASSKYSPDGRLAAPLSVDSADMAAYFAEEEAALASHRREASVASKRVADAANAKAQENRTSAQPEDGYARNFTTKGEVSREKNRREDEDDEFSSSGLPTLPLSMPTVSHSEPQIAVAQQLRSRLQAQTRSQMQEQEDRQLRVHEQDTSAAAVTRSVTLLPMERKDSSDFSRHMQQRRIDQQRAAKALADDARIPSGSHLTSSPIQMAAASPSRLDGAEESFQAELRAFDLPSFPAMQQHQQDHPDYQDHQDADLEADRLHLHEEAQRTQAIERSAEADGEVFVDIEHRIEAEEEALSNYLSWLENQHSGSTPLPSVSKHAQAAAAAAPAGTAAVASSNSSNPSIHSSGIPRYSGLSRSADGDESAANQQSKSNSKSKLRVSADHNDSQSGDGLRVFSPRDAAMRAEQAHVGESEDNILFSSETKHNGVNPLRKLFR